MSRFTPEEKVRLARHPDRPGTVDFIHALFTDFFEQRGDRLCGEDASILGGIARFHGRPVTVVGHRKGKNLEENLRCNFGMPSPEGYRKAQRLMRQAEKFGRPVITFVGPFLSSAVSFPHCGFLRAILFRPWVLACRLWRATGIRMLLNPVPLSPGAL